MGANGEERIRVEKTKGQELMNSLPYLLLKSELWASPTPR